MRKSKQLAIFATSNVRSQPIPTMDMINIQNIDKATVVSFSGINKLNVTATQKVKSDIISIISSNGHLVLDLDNIIYVDSTGFGMMLSLLRHCKNNNTELSLCNIGVEVMELIKLLQLQNIFDIRENVEQCLKK